MNAALVPQPPVMAAADFALSMARGQSGAAASSALANRKSLIGGAQLVQVAPAGLSTPITVPLAVIPMTARASGVFQFNFMLSYTDSAADTVGLQVSVGPAVTIVGGTITNGITWESSPITIAGYAGVQVPTTWQQTFATGNLTGTASVQGLTAALVPGVASLIVLFISAAHDLSAMALSASAYELP